MTMIPALALALSAPEYERNDDRALDERVTELNYALNTNGAGDKLHVMLSITRTVGDAEKKMDQDPNTIALFTFASILNINAVLY